MYFVYFLLKMKDMQKIDNLGVLLACQDEKIGWHRLIRARLLGNIANTPHW